MRSERFMDRTRDAACPPVHGRPFDILVPCEQPKAPVLLAALDWAFFPEPTIRGEWVQDECRFVNVEVLSDMWGVGHGLLVHHTLPSLGMVPFTGRHCLTVWHHSAGQTVK